MFYLFVGGIIPDIFIVNPTKNTENQTKKDCQIHKQRSINIKMLCVSRERTMDC